MNGVGYMIYYLLKIGYALIGLNLVNPILDAKILVLLDGGGGVQRPPANCGPIWATKNPKTVLESSQKMSLGLSSARKTKNVI